MISAHDERPQMSVSDYMNARVDEQIAWYEASSRFNKRGHLAFQIGTMLAAALIPLVAFFADESWARFTVVGLGALTASATGIAAVYQFRELWVDYRATAEALKHEKFLFYIGSGPYVDAHRFVLFVERIEMLLSTENTSWQQRLMTAERPTGTSEVSDTLKDSTLGPTAHLTESSPDGSTR